MYGLCVFTICSEERPLGELGEILEPSLNDLGFVRLRQCTSLSVYDVSTYDTLLVISTVLLFLCLYIL